MIVERIQSAEEVFQLRDEWNALLKASRSHCLFLTHEWLSTWWKHLREGRHISIFAARENGRLIGLVPLAVRPPQYARMMPRILAFIASGIIGSDYLDAIIERGRENQVLRGFPRQMRRLGWMLQVTQRRRR